MIRNRVMLYGSSNIVFMLSTTMVSRGIHRAPASTPVVAIDTPPEGHKRRASCDRAMRHPQWVWLSGTLGCVTCNYRGVDRLALRYS